VASLSAAVPCCRAVVPCAICVCCQRLCVFILPSEFYIVWTGLVAQTGLVTQSDYGLVSHSDQSCPDARSDRNQHLSALAYTIAYTIAYCAPGTALAHRVSRLGAQGQQTIV